MNFDENITEVFDRYLTGGMNEAEEKEFLQQLDTDPAFKEAYEWHRTIVAGIRDARRDELKDYIKKNAKIRYIGNVWGRKWVMASAAIITLFFASYVAIEYFIKPAAEQSQTATKTDGQTDSSVTAKTEDTEQLEENKTPVIKPEPQNNSPQRDDRDFNDENRIEVPPAIDNYVKKDNTENEDVAPEIKKQIDVYTVNRIKKENKTVPTVAETSSNNNMWVYFKPANKYSYEYTKDRLTLYRVQYEDKIAVYELEKASYLGWNKNYYPLKKDGKINPLEKLSDTTLLKTLPPLK